jgi:molybdopterin-guanine dinucleotide biosynthesis protein A
MTTSYDAVVLAGGAARRLGGADKPAVSVGGRMLLDRVLAACAGAGSTVVVGPRRPTARPVRWTREDPPGGGPLPALAAGLAALGGTGAAGAAPGTADVVLVLAADLPFLSADTVAALLGALSVGPTAGEPAGHEVTDGEGVVLTDTGGRDQPLAGAYRVEPLRRELSLLRAEHGGLTGLPLRLLTGELALRRIADPTGEASFDCDTWEDVAVARARLDAGAEG